MNFDLILKIQVLLTMSFTAVQMESTIKKYFSAKTFRNAVTICRQGNGTLIKGDIPSTYNLTWISEYRVRTDWIYTNGCINSDNVVGSHLNFSLAENDVTKCFHACLLNLGNSSLRYIALQVNLCICLKNNSFKAKVNITSGCDKICQGESNTENRCGGKQKYSLYEIENKIPFRESAGFCAYQNITGQLDIVSCTSDKRKFACKSTEGTQTIVNSKTWNEAREACQSNSTELNTELLDGVTNVWIGLRIMTKTLQTEDIPANMDLDQNYFRLCTYWNNTELQKGSCLREIPFYCIYEATATQNENDVTGFVPSTDGNDQKRSEATATPTENDVTDSVPTAEGNDQKRSDLLIIIPSGVAGSVIFIIVVLTIICMVRRSKIRKSKVNSQRTISHHNASYEIDQREIQNDHMYDSARDLPNTVMEVDRHMEKKGQKNGDLDMYDHTETSSRPTMSPDSATYDHVTGNENMYDKAVFKPQHGVPNDLYDHMSAK